MRPVIESRAIGPRDAVGGKARHLALLLAAGQNVPPFYVITADAFREAEARVRALGDLARLRAALLEAPIAPDLANAIRRAQAECLPKEALVAVRSSAADEDAPAQSFAGLHDSFLFVRGEEALFGAIRKVWASGYNERAIAYRREQGLPLSGLAVAVVVQQMVPARASGVLFTANPVGGDVHEMVASAVLGAGEGLVSAGLDADTFTIDKETLAVRAAPARKEEQLVFDEKAGSGLVRVPVAQAQREAPCLREEEIQALAAAGLAIERHFGRPQDIEFSFDGSGRLFVLQSRPVTTISERGPAAGNRLIWDNSNIIESYSGVTSPMTFSFIRRAYTIVYHCFASVMGIEDLRAHQQTFENMLGLFRGQVYYNLLNWYRLVGLFPGFNYNRRFMESMMGLKKPADLAEERALGWRQRYFVELPALIRLLLRSTWNFLTIRRQVSEFDRHFKHHYVRWSAIDFDALPVHELRRLYLEMEDALLWNWKAPIINDFFVMIFYGTLKKLCSSWCSDTSGSLQNDLICGEGGIESTEPTRMLLALAQVAQRDPALREAIVHRPPEELAASVPQEARFADFNALFARYLDLYGFRCMNELKLEEYSLRDKPQFIYRVLRNYLALDDPARLDVGAIAERERRIRGQAEERAFGAVGRGPRRWIFRQVLANARLGVTNRENMRFARTRIYGLVRQLLRAAGRRLADEKLLGDAEDVFYLTLDELWDFVKGTAVTTDLRGLVELRRREFDGYRKAESPDDRFETFGMAYLDNAFRDRRRAARGSEGGGLRGTGCCPGTISGPVKVLRSPADDMRLSGEILVAERTDPGWVPLYPSISGLLIERGSILSHSAIVAREMGIPTIVGIPGLMTALKTGDRVSMDGSSGTVTPLPSTTEPDP